METEMTAPNQTATQPNGGTNTVARVPDAASDLRPDGTPNVASNGTSNGRAVAAEPAEADGRLARLLTQGVIVLVLLGVCGAAYYYFTHSSQAPAAQQAGGPGGPLPVGVMTAQPRDVPLSQKYVAQTEPSQTVPIRARVNGYLVERNFEEGQKVDKDQVLFRIDPQPYQVALDQAKAGLAAAQARVDRAKQQSTRYQGLAAQQSAAQSELEQAQEEQKVAQAQIQTQQSLIDTAQLNLDYATIKSPIDGVIGQRQQDVGSYINGMGGDALLATVRKVDPIYVRFSVSEQDLLKWQRLEANGEVNRVKVPDLSVTVVLGDGRVYPLKGKINYVDVAVNPSTGTAVTRATVPNPDGALLPGQYVTANITGISRLGAITVPQACVTQSPGGASVYVLGDDDTVKTRQVKLGEWTGSDWIIDSGLEAGDRVVVDHLAQLGRMPPGAKVQPGPPATRPAAPSTGFDDGGDPAATQPQQP